MSKVKFKWILLLVMLFTVATVTIPTSKVVYAAETTNFIFDKETQTITGFEGDLPDVVVVPPKIDGVTVDKIKSGLFYNENIESLEIPNTVKILKSNGTTTSGLLDIKKARDCYLINGNTWIVCYTGEKYGEYYFDKATQTITKYTNYNTKKLAIPAKIDGVQVKTIGESAFRGLNLYTVEVPEGVVTIEKEAFIYNWIQTVKLPSTLVTIGDSAFATNDMFNVAIPDSVKSIGKECFAYNEMTWVTLGAGLETIGESAFSDNWLETVTIPSKVKEIPKKCFTTNYLTSVKFSANGNLKTIGTYAFQSNRLTDVTLPEGLESVGYGAFKYNDINNVTMPSTLKTIKSYAFSGNNFSYLSIPSTVIKIGEGAFADNDNYLEVDVAATLKEVIIGTTDKTVPADLDSFMEYGVFDYSYDVNIIKGEEFGVFYFDKATGTVTEYVGNSGDVVIPDEFDGTPVTVLGSELFFDIYLTSVIIPESVVTIEDYAFYNCGLSEVTLPSGLKTIGNFAFRFNSLETVVIPDSVEKIGVGAFGENNIKNVTMPNYLQTIGYGAFYENNIKRVEVPGTITKFGVQEYYGDGYAEDPIGTDTVAESLEEYHVFDDTTEVVVYSDYKFGDFYINVETGTITGYSDLGAKNIEIPSDVNGKVVTKIGDSAFEKMDIESVVIPETIVEIGVNAFNSNNLVDVKLPESVTTLGRGVFSNNQISTLELSKNITEISDNAFANNNIQTVTIPDGVTYIGRGAFENNKLSEVVIPSTVTEIGTRAFYSNNIREVNVPKTVVNIVGYVGDNADGKYEKELYEVSEQQLIDLKVFDDDVVIKIKNGLDIAYIIGFGVGILVLGGVVVLILSKRKGTQDNNNGVRENKVKENNEKFESRQAYENTDDVDDLNDLEKTKVIEPIRNNKE